LKAVRSSDSICRADENNIINTLSRLGGDEFVVLLSEIANVPDAAIVARRLLKDISEPYMLRSHKVVITASIGISVYPSDGEDAQSLLKYADLAMYHAKDMGKNNYQYYTESMKSAAFERLNLEGELNKALEQDEFLVYYQAKLDVKSREIIGMEALIRWKHPVKELISPSEFLHLAEETGQIIAIDEWVLHTACLQNKVWQDSGFAPMVIAVNLSTSHLENRKLTKVVARALQNSGLDPKYLELEITESKIMKNPVMSIMVLNELKAMGVRIAIDDFGTGHSSLNYLRQIPLDYVKIDRFFVMNIATSQRDTAIIRSIIALAHSLDLKVIAEGVETEQQLEILCGLQCDEVQGYLFSKPVTADVFTQLLKTGKTL
jgi:EAL domain-containing protein (putative c-di-GMP-specific phosphodiesterase class I)